MTTSTVRARVSGAATLTLDLRVIDCPTCGVVFALTEGYAERRQSDGRSFWCPNGHAGINYGKSTAERLRDDLERAQRTANREGQWRIQAEREAEAARRSTIAYKGHLTRIRRKIAAGVCPCCRRSFSNVQRHIAGRHPEFVAKANEATA